MVWKKQGHPLFKVTTQCCILILYAQSTVNLWWKSGVCMPPYPIVVSV